MLTATTEDASTVLLVDDDEALRRTTVDILELNGFAAHAAGTGRLALRMVRELQPAPIVAVVDLRLPDMNGLDLTHELRAFNHEMQVVILTGNGSVETAIRALRDEECDYLLKPIEPTLLVRTLRTAESRWRLRRTQAELARTQQVLQATFQASPVPIVSYDERSRVTLWNPAAERLFGWSASEVMHKVPPIVFPEDDAAAGSLHRASLRGESFVGIEVRRRRRDGQTLHLRVSQAPLMDASGVPNGLLSMYEDVTERRRIDEHLRETQRLDAIGRLAGGMAHDFNNLLAVILGEVDLALEDREIDPRVRETFQSVRFAAGSGAALTRQLLTFARRQKTEPTVFNANLLIMELDRLILRLVGDRVSVETTLAADLGSVHGDRRQLEQVLTNLAVNARDAMPDGGTIRIRTENRPTPPAELEQGRPPRDWVMIEVSDTGTGIPDDVRERLFEPFFTTKERGKGTGLGLATSYGIVEQYGGFIALETELGKGSVFRIFLPRVEDGVFAAPQPATAERAGGSESVLVVEDRPELRQVAVRILERRGYTVRAATTGVEAERLIARMPDRPDLVVLDVNLPDGSGIALAGRLAERYPGMRILLTSGADVPPATHDQFAFLEKPYGTEDLTIAVRRVLDGESGKRPDTRS